MSPEFAPISGLPALRARLGQELGRSDWVTLDQARINAFAGATGDDQWIHVDVERARAEGPFGGTVAHGFLTLSLLPMLGAMAYRVDGVRGKVNYGLNRVRFPSPVPAGEAVRGVFVLKAIEPMDQGRHLVTIDVTIERHGSERPACVAEILALYME